MKFLREHAPGYENCHLLSAGAQIGVRETRHFIGVSTLTEDDIATARVFPDWVVTKAHFNFDIHNIKGAGLDEHGEQHHFAAGATILHGASWPAASTGLLPAASSPAPTRRTRTSA